MFLQSSNNLGIVMTCTIDEDDGEEVVDCNTKGRPSPTVPLLPGVLEMADALPVDFLLA